MALTNRERQARWRKKHPETASRRLEALKRKKSEERPRCQHPRQQQICDSPIKFLLCRDCGQLLFVVDDMTHYCEVHNIPFRRTG